MVVDFTLNDRTSGVDQEQSNSLRQQFNSEVELAVTDAAIDNFCPKMRQAVRYLSRHKVGPLQLRVSLSDFRSSATLSPPETNKLCSSVPRFDRFVLGLPYLCPDVSEKSRHSFMVRWSIVLECSYPEKSPEIILMGTENSPVTMVQEDTLRRPQNQRTHLVPRRLFQTSNERMWQQFVNHDTFNVYTLSKWNKINEMKKKARPELKYCLLADDLYHSYTQFQQFKLKASLKTTPSTTQPPSYLVQAYNQYKQLMKFYKSSLKQPNLLNDINFEVSVDVEVRICVIISLVSYEPTASTSTAESNDNNANNKVLIPLASVTSTFTPSATKNSSLNNSSGSKKYVLRILNPILHHSTQKGSMMTEILNSATERYLEPLVMDFVTYVHHVQFAAFQAYNSDILPVEEDQDDLISLDDDDTFVELLLKSLFEIFCESSSNGNYLLDYHTSNQDTTDKTTCFIRFLLVDGDIDIETTQLKYILTIVYNKEVFKECQRNLQECCSLDDGNEVDEISTKKVVPVVSLRSVYDDEKCEEFLKIDITSILSEEDDEKYNDELAAIIKTATINGIRQMRHKVVEPVLNRYNKRWSPTDPYFAESLVSPPPYPSP